jgi:hypothetical protein
MKQNLSLLALMVVTALFLTGPAWAQCPQDSMDLGVCDSIYVEAWPYTDTCFSGDCVTAGNKINNPGSRYPCFFYVSLFVTHDSNTFWSTNFDPPRWVQDSIAAFVVPLKYWKTGQADSVILPTYSHFNNTTISRTSSWFKRSIFRDFVDTPTGDTVYNRHAYMGNELYWDSWTNGTFFKAPDTAFFSSIAPGNGRWWEGSKVLLATYTFIVYMADGETTRVCFDSTFWPPEENLSFVRHDAEQYFPRSNLPICFQVPPYAQEPVDCDRSYSDPCLVACPLDDIPFKVYLKNSTGGPVTNYSNVRLNLSGCSGITPCSTEPYWSTVLPDGPSDANGVVIFHVNAGGCDNMHQAQVRAGCGIIGYVPVKTVDVDGDHLVEIGDWHGIGADPCNDYNCNGEINYWDLDFFRNHIAHGCNIDPCLLLITDLTATPDTLLPVGDTHTVRLFIKNNYAQSCTAQYVEFYRAGFGQGPNLVLFATQYLGKELAPGDTVSTQADFVVPGSGSGYILTKLYTSCCAHSIDATFDFVYRMCPAAETRWVFPITLSTTPAYVETLEYVPDTLGWLWFIYYTGGRPDSVAIITPATSPLGVTGAVELYFYDQYGNSLGHRKCEVLITLKSGDVSSDCMVNSADIAYLINYLFVGGPAPNPIRAGDVNCDCWINSADVIYLINYLFIAGPAPVLSETCECGYKGWLASP